MVEIWQKMGIEPFNLLPLDSPSVTKGDKSKWGSLVQYMKFLTNLSSLHVWQHYNYLSDKHNPNENLTEEIHTEIHNTDNERLCITT
jgi:hypothetical protein